MFKMKILLLVVLASISSIATELSSYLEYLGGYEIVKKDSYEVIIQNEFTEISADIGDFKKDYLDSDSNNQLLDVYLPYVKTKKKMDLVPFKPTLTAFLMANIPLDIDGVEMFDSSLDVGYFFAKDQTLEGGVIVFHGYTPEVMGVRFLKTIHVTFNGEFITSRLANLTPGMLEDYFLK